MRRFAFTALLALLLAGPTAALVAPRAHAETEAERTARLVATLRTRRLRDVKFDGADLEKVLAWLRVATRANFVVKHDVLKKAGIDPATVTAKLDLDDVTVATVLQLVLEPYGLVAVVRGNIVYVTTKADSLGKPVLVLHPISHITWRKVDFHGPDLDLHPSGYVADEHPEEVEVEDDPLADPQNVIDLVKQLVEAPWDTEGWSLVATKQVMTVRAPRSVQAEVTRALVIVASFK